MTQNRLALLLLAAVMLLAFTARVIPTPRNVDDSYITFRYSRNIVQGEGFVYNPGVRTLGTTTPLYTLLMAGVSLIARGEAFPWYALVVNALADAINAALLFTLMRRLTTSLYPAALIGGVWALAPQSVTFAIGGMETSVTILWMLAAALAFLDKRRVWVGVFAGLGVLTRPDSALWILPLGLYQLGAVYRANPGKPLLERLPWQTWLAGLLTIAPWVVFAMLYFGSPLPNSLSAKTVAYIIPEWDALVLLLQRYATPFMDFDTFGSSGAMTGAVVYPTLNLFAFFYVWRKQPRLTPFLIYPWLYFVVFSLANPLMFRWYFVPPLPFWIFGVIAGIWSVVEPLSRRIKVAAPVVAVGLGALWSFTLLNAWTLTPDHGPSHPAPAMAWHLIELRYEEIGKMLKNDYGVTPQTAVASADIGAVGYYSKATIVDTVGLVTPALSRYYPFDRDILVTEPDRQNYAIPPQLILDTQPSYFVTPEGFIRQGLLQVPAFTDNYTLIEEIPFEFYGTGIRVYAQNAVLAQD